MDSNSEIYQVNRLIYLSMAYSNARRLDTRQQAEMEELMQRFQASEEFRQIITVGIEAMELRLLSYEDRGLRLSAKNTGSYFASTLTDYGKVLARTELKAADVLCIHCAIATAFFPTDADLDAPVEDLGVILVEDVVEILRRFSKQEANLEEDDDLLHPHVRTVALRIRELPEENPDSRRMGGGNSWSELIGNVIRHMVETGYILQFDEANEIEYRPTPAYQAAIREGMVYTFNAFRKLVTNTEE
ncbi:hypothetical protein QUF76_13375 [Desulfobacterales bacterium HSG16]|nr:hypothetical protein [Desulfobacterales bacterium HSG16]